MHDGEKVIAEGTTFKLCQENAEKTKVWDMAPGTVAPYYITTMFPSKCYNCLGVGHHQDENEDYIVFESIGEDVEQYSIQLTLERAVTFLLSMEKLYPNRYFYICRKLSQHEIEEVKKHLVTK